MTYDPDSAFICGQSLLNNIVCYFLLAIYVVELTVLCLCLAKISKYYQ